MNLYINRFTFWDFVMVKIILEILTMAYSQFKKKWNPHYLFGFLFHSLPLNSRSWFCWYLNQTKSLEIGPKFLHVRKVVFRFWKQDWNASSLKSPLILSLQYVQFSESISKMSQKCPQCKSIWCSIFLYRKIE